MSDSRCVECGSPKVGERIVPLTVEHGVKSGTTMDRQTFCEGCQNVSYVGSQISEHQRAVTAAIREMDGLLSPEALNRIRAKYRFKQTDMEQILSTGPKTWTRWERGKVPHGKAADKLLRLMAEDPEIAKQLMEQAGVVNQDASETFAQIEESAKTFARALILAEMRKLQSLEIDHVAERVVDTVFDAAKSARRKASKIAEAA